MSRGKKYCKRMQRDKGGSELTGWKVTDRGRSQSATKESGIVAASLQLLELTLIHTTLGKDREDEHLAAKVYTQEKWIGVIMDS